VNRVVDYSALLYPIPREQVDAFKADSKAAGKPWAVVSAGQIVGAVIAVLMIGGVVIGFGIVFLGLAIGSLTDGGNPVGLVASIFPAFFIAAFVAVAIVVVRSVLKGGQWETWLRLDTFARANGMNFSPRDANPRYPGAIFNIGDTRLVTNHLTSASDRFSRHRQLPVLDRQR
jgi:hypothetical protein